MSATCGTDIVQGQSLRDRPDGGCPNPNGIACRSPGLHARSHARATLGIQAPQHPSTLQGVVDGSAGHRGPRLGADARIATRIPESHEPKYDDDSDDEYRSGCAHEAPSPAHRSRRLRRGRQSVVDRGEVCCVGLKRAIYPAGFPVRMKEGLSSRTIRQGNGLLPVFLWSNGEGEAIGTNSPSSRTCDPLTRPH